MNYLKLKDHSDKYSIIFLPENEIEENTIEIVNNLSNCTVFNHIRVMPDCHASVNCCVGFTSEINDRVIPNIVGGDIGCGISSYPLNKKIKKKQYKKIDQMVKETIPLGGDVHKISIVTDIIMNNIFKECNKKLDFLKFLLQQISQLIKFLQILNPIYLLIYLNFGRKKNYLENYFCS